MRTVLNGAFALLEALGTHGPAGLGQLAALTGLPKSTTHRLLDQLCELGAVERRAHTYRTGVGLFRLGQTWQCELRELARERLPVLSAGMRVTLALVVAPALVVASAVLPDGTVAPGVRAARRVLVRPRPFVVDAAGIAVPVRTAAGGVTAALAAVLPTERNPLSLVAGLTSAANALGAVSA